MAERDALDGTGAASDDEAAESRDAHGDIEEIRPRGTQPDVIEAADDRIIVSAGAGTGKTQTMAWRIEAAIEGDTAPDRILVLTFANKAAHSIQDDLGDLLDDGRGYDVDAYTYHSFCHRLLAEYAYYFDLDPEFDLVTEDERRAIIQSIVDDLEYRFVEPIDARTGDDRVERDLVDFIEELKRSGIDPDEVDAILPETETIAALSELARQLRDLGIRLFDTDRNPALKDDPLAFERRFDAYRRVLRHQRSRLEDGTPIEADVAGYLGSMLELVDEVEGLLLDGASSWYERFVPQALFAGTVPSFFADTHQTPIGRLVAYVELLQEAHDFLPGYRAYERTLRGEGAYRSMLDYDDLIGFATDLLDDDGVREELVGQWDAILCDEFQDTDGAQLEFITRLAAESELFVIGDADQAIYEWRGAHPENMARITDELDDFASYNLDLNFRSPDAVLDLAAELPADTHGLDAHKDDVENAVVRVDAADDEDEQATQVSTAISKLIKGEFSSIDRADLGDVAVLVRTNRQANLVASHLDEACLPYELPHDAGGDVSPGIETVLAYLRVLVDPHDDVSLNRVLAVFYRFSAADLDRLNRGPGSAYDELTDRPASEFDAPDRVGRARSHVEELREVRRSRSISELYAELTSTTNFEWFLTADERRDLAAIERLIETFDEGRVTQSTLTEAFVSYVELQGDLAGRDRGGTIETAEKAADKINVMTIFQAKGLEFDVVLLPFLSADDWPPLPPGRFPNPYAKSTHSFAAIADLVEGDRATSLRTDLSAREVPEEWRILHVGITRARERLFLFGRNPADPDVPAAQLDGYLPDEIEWSVRGPHMDVWERITDAYETLDDRFTTDLTDPIDAGLDRDSVSLQYFQDPISLDAAIDEALDLASQLRAGTLSGTDPEAIGVRTDPTRDLERRLERRHSHSSIETVTGCERRHVLDHVLYAFEDPLAYSVPDSPDATGPTPTAVGTLFHAVAEEAFWRSYESRDQWAAACERLGRAHGTTDAIDEAKRCVDRYFETAAADWESVGAEIPFELDPNESGVSGTIVGEIDAIARDLDGTVVVLDYKTGSRRMAPEESSQLLLYLLAARRTLSVPIEAAGYVYVGEAGPDVQLADAEQLLDARPALDRALRTADESQFGDDSDGRHCYDCPHKSLGCASDEFYGRE
ncbi:ATP-dependent helicase [Halosolutus gelatinilyticus]|uniref:ATP-dependent helicase n=1 Tax=Halosolutus gelatinilyticus TaxID=2931975 RepID=UPI001FF4A142|nr:ATP-dependent DNA helicase [Halosolutus gelatinilyticus]